MKKIFLPLALVLTVGFSSTALAAPNVFTTNAPTGTTTGVMQNVRTSTNVKLVCSSGPAQYAAVAAHTQGTRTFGSTSGSTLLFWQDKVSGTELTDTAINNSDTAQFDTWTSL
jgi:hypothetical protein